MNKILILIPLILIVILELNLFNLKNILNNLKKYFRILFIVLLCLVVYKYQNGDKNTIPSLENIYKKSSHNKMIKSITKLIVSFVNIFNQKNNSILTNNIKNQNSAKYNIRHVTESKKKIVAANQKWRCKHCQILLEATYEIDHIQPIYKGGNNNFENLQALCRNCHGKKTLEDRFNI